MQVSRENNNFITETITVTVIKVIKKYNYESTTDSFY